MAEIKMDVSEYEALKENKRLLEDSLKKERELHEQIKVLSDEKTKALEDAKMKVVKISRVENTEFLYTRAYDWREKIISFLHSINLDYRSMMGVSFDNIDFQSLSLMFERTKSTFTSPDIITTHGLDEIKEEIREDLKKKMDGDIKNKLERAEEALLRDRELLEENEKLKHENNGLHKMNKELMKHNEEVLSELSLIKDCTKVIEELKVLLSNSKPGLFRNKKILNKVADIIRNTKVN
jgi:cell shape-determining protein MreC